MNKISILGSTGSIGRQALDVIKSNSDKFQIEALACGYKIDILETQIQAYNPNVVSVAKEEDALNLQKKYPKIQVFYGEEGLKNVATSNCQTLINALVGIKGLLPTIEGIRAEKNIALANKETLVAGGSLVMEEAKKKGVSIIPIDSEHSAIFQCLQGNEKNKVSRILLTASGGPFRTYSKEQLEKVTVRDALNHPKWTMGEKITIDSATMMNKGLEVIEAKWLFNVDYGDIEVLIHPQSIVHSMVEYEDSSIIAQLGKPDMRVPIAYSLTYPKRRKNTYEKLDFFSEAKNLSFEKPNMDIFPCLRMAFEAGEKAGSYPVVLNGANEVLVDLFLNKKISFLDISKTLEKIMDEHKSKKKLSLDEILNEDKEIRVRVKELFGRKI